MLTAAELDARREMIGGVRRPRGAGAPPGGAARRRCSPEPPVVPTAKALLSADGGVCPDDGAPLAFDPWSPAAHRCPRCGRVLRRRAPRPRVGAVPASLARRAGRHAGRPGRADRARGRGRPRGRDLSGLRRRATSISPTATTCSARAGCSSRPTSSRSGSPTTSRRPACCARAGCCRTTLAEGVGVRRRRGRQRHRRVRRGLLQPADLAQRRARRDRGLVRGRGAADPRGAGPDRHARPPGAGLRRGRDVVRGRELPSLRAARPAASRWAGPGRRAWTCSRTTRLAARLAAALRAPALSALPDYTFPARKDSRFGVSLAQPMYLELWEVGLARLGDAARSAVELAPRALRGARARGAAPSIPTSTRPDGPAPAGPRTRADLSWWALLEMAPSLPEAPEPWAPGRVLLERQGLAILREGARYASLECGRYGGGHGHPDRLSLTLHADGHHWLADPGTGSYVDAGPRLVSLDAGAQRAPARRALAAAAATRAATPSSARAAGAGPGAGSATSPARWWPDRVPARRGRARRRRRAHARAAVASRGPRRGGDARRLDRRSARRPVRRARGALHRRHRRRRAPPSPCRRRRGAEPPPPIRGRAAPRVGPGPARRRRRAPRSTWCAPGAAGLGSSRCSRAPAAAPAVRGVSVEGEVMVVETGRRHRTATRPRPGGLGDRHRGRDACGSAGSGAPGRGGRAAHRSRTARARARAAAVYVPSPPALDGIARRVRRVRAADAGPRGPVSPERGAVRRARGVFRHRARSTGTPPRSTSALDVVKAETVVRPDDAPPLRLDNEPDDIHADGVQLYSAPRRRARCTGCWSCSADDAARIRVRPTSGTAGDPAMVTGAWQPTGTGYSLTLAHHSARVAVRAAATCSASTCSSTRCSPAGSGGRASWSGAVAAAGSTSAATGTRPTRFGDAGARVRRLGRGVHLHRQQAARRRCSAAPRPALPSAMVRSAGCRVWDAEGREYLDSSWRWARSRSGTAIPRSTEAAVRAVRDGVVGPLPPVLEEEVAARARPADPLDRAGALPQDRRGGHGRGGAAGARGHGPGRRAGLRLSRLARLVPGAGAAGVPGRHPRALRRAAVQ